MSRSSFRRALAVLVASLPVAFPVAPAPASATATGAPQLYSLDGWGGLHPYAGSPELSTTAYWQGWDIARGLALLPDGSAGLVLDGWGGLHAAGNLSVPQPGAYWQGWDIARGVALAPWSTSASPQGWVLDGWGGLHPFGGAPAVSTTTYWHGWDIARGLVVLPDSTPSSPAGYVLDGYGGVHPFGAAPALSPGAYWPGWDIARGIALAAGSTTSSPAGYVLDGYGGLHAFGAAAGVSPGDYWQGWDIARGIAMWAGAPAGNPGGWVIDGYGGAHAFGSAPDESASAYWAGWDIARGAGSPGGGSSARGDGAPPPPARAAANAVNHVYVIVMENRAYADVVGSAAAPYFNALLPWGTLLTDYHGVTHPSLPNYLALFAGSTFGISTDCTSCYVSAPNLGDRLTAAGLRWRAYEESMPQECYAGDYYPYAQKHDPAMYFNDIRLTAACSNVVPYAQMAADLSSASEPAYAYITPNLCDDMHDCSTGTGDQWLQSNVPAILNSPAFADGHSILAIVWDEDDGSTDNHVPALLLGAVPHGVNDGAAYTHYSLLRAIERAWGLAPLAGGDSAASPVAEIPPG